MNIKELLPKIQPGSYILHRLENITTLEIPKEGFYRNGNLRIIFTEMQNDYIWVYYGDGIKYTRRDVIKIENGYLDIYLAPKTNYVKIAGNKSLTGNAYVSFNI